MSDSTSIDLPHRAPVKTGVLLLNLGTPEAPTPSAIRRYLKPFLSDRRVVELPRPLWLTESPTIPAPGRGRPRAPVAAKLSH